MQNNNIYNSLYQEISKLPVIDTHEHLEWNEASNGWNSAGDILGEYLIHYMRSDVISAGLSKSDLAKVVDGTLDINERWHIIEPFWEVSRYTGYGRALDKSVKAIYGIEGINRNTIEQLNQLFLERKRPGHYQHVLKELCNIEISLLDVWTFREKGENPLFKRIWQPQNFIKPSEPHGADILAFLKSEHGINVHTFDDWMEACEAELDWQLNNNNARVIKSAIAYHRTLFFNKVSYQTAKSLFNEVLITRKDGECMIFPLELQDFMMHHVLSLANKRNLTFQFHTGLLEGNGNILSNSNPMLLNNLFGEYPDVDFDLFHIGYPFYGATSALCKMYPNVYIDMCWAHIISPSSAVNALDDFLDAIPYNKISAFGGDYLFPDGIFGHLMISRENISRVLAKKIDLGVFGEEKALEIAKALYYDNPKRIFKL